MSHPKTTSRKFREEFDRDRTYKVHKFFKFNGKAQEVNTVFDKALTNTRKLRQLYEQRYLVMAAFDEPLVPNGPVMPNFPAMPEKDLREWLLANGRTPHPMAKHPRLVARAVRRWQELHDPTVPPPVVKAPVEAPKHADRT